MQTLVDWQGDELGALAAHAMQEVGGMTYVLARLMMLEAVVAFSSALDLAKKGLMA